MRTLRALALASHLAPTLVMTTAVGALSWAGGWRGPQVLVGVLAVLTGQLSVGWSNDAHDASLDRSVARTDKPVVSGAVGPGVLWRAAAGAVILTVPLSWLAAGWIGGTFHLAGAGAAWGYNLALSRTIWSWLPFAVAFACIAPYVTFGAPEPQAPAPWFVGALGLLGVGAHAANALPDLGRDRAAGVGGLATRIGRVPTVVVAATAVAGATALLLPAAHAATPVASAGLAVALGVTGIVVLWRRHDDRTAFAGLMLLALADVVVVVLAGIPLTG